MSNDEEFKFERLFRIVGNQFEDHSKKIDNLLSSAQEKFVKDHTGTSAGVGILMIAFSIGFGFLDKGAPIIITLSVLGTIILCLSLFMRHRSSEKQIKYSETMLDLERERARFAQKHAILSHLWLKGIPEEMSTDQLQLLLGETMSVSSDQKLKQLKTGEMPPQKEHPEN